METELEELVSVRPLLALAPSSSCALTAALTDDREKYRHRRKLGQITSNTEPFTDFNKAYNYLSTSVCLSLSSASHPALHRGCGRHWSPLLHTQLLTTTLPSALSSAFFCQFHEYPLTNLEGCFINLLIICVLPPSSGNLRLVGSIALLKQGPGSCRQPQE